MYCGCSESETWQSDPRWSAVTCAFVISPSPAVALLCRREILMCVMCSLRVCIPGEILGAEAGERNESCAVNHSLPRRRRRGDACRKQQLHTKRTTATHREVGYISTCPTAVCSTDALTHAEWHISTLCFFSHALKFRQQSDFLPELFCMLAYLFAQTCTYDCQSWKCWRERMRNKKGGHTMYTLFYLLRSLQSLSLSNLHFLIHSFTLQLLLKLPLWM